LRRRRRWRRRGKKGGEDVGIRIDGERKKEKWTSAILNTSKKRKEKQTALRAGM